MLFKMQADLPASGCDCLHLLTLRPHVFLLLTRTLLLTLVIFTVFSSCPNAPLMNVSFAFCRFFPFTRSCFLLRPSVPPLGSIPPAIGYLTMLQQLELQGNSLTDSIPKEIGGLVSLQYLGLHNNALSGECLQCDSSIVRRAAQVHV